MNKKDETSLTGTQPTLEPPRHFFSIRGFGVPVWSMFNDGFTLDVVFRYREQEYTNHINLLLPTLEDAKAFAAEIFQEGIKDPEFGEIPPNDIIRILFKTCERRSDVIE